MIVRKPRQIKAICRQLMQFSEADSLNMSDDYFSFALNNLRIKDDAQLKLFMQLYAQLIELTDGGCSLNGEFSCSFVENIDGETGAFSRVSNIGRVEDWVDNLTYNE